MYALHPGSLPPKSPKATERIEVDADDLIALYAVPPEECIVWNAADGYDWFDFIHLYPSYYERYTLKRDGTPEKDIPCGFKFASSSGDGTLRGSPAVTSTRAKNSTRSRK